MEYDFTPEVIKRDAKRAFHAQWGVAVLVTLFMGFFSLVSEAGSTVTNIAAKPDEYKVQLGEELVELIIKYYEKYALTILIVYLAIKLFTTIAQYGQCKLFVDIVEGNDARFSSIFDGFLYVFKAVGTSIYIIVLVFLWACLLIVPGLIAAIKYSMTSYIIAENPDTPITDAVDMSRNMMDGHKMDYLMLVLSFVPWLLLVAVTCGLASFYVAPYMNTATAQFYIRVRDEYNAEHEMGNRMVNEEKSDKEDEE